MPIHGAAVADLQTSKASASGLDPEAIYGKFEAKASPFRMGMKPTNSIQPPTTAQTGFQRDL
ncbi:hypothetical protein DVK02_09500 [Halobellus sp. Atlit-31R]|nr:hypothetical protein DVK02_09500 [Halobellus sp. Atlit-31R]